MTTQQQIEKHTKILNLLNRIMDFKERKEACLNKLEFLDDSERSDNLKSIVETIDLQITAWEAEIFKIQ